MALQSLLLVAGDLDGGQRTEQAGGRSNGAAEPVADCLTRCVGYAAGDMSGRISARLGAFVGILNWALGAGLQEKSQTV